MSSTRYRIARDGSATVVTLVAAGFLLMILVNLYLGLALLILAALLAWFFRDPDRETPSNPLAVISPVDGRVVAIETDHDPVLDREALRVTLRMNRMGTYSIRSPIEGKMQQRVFVYEGESRPDGLQRGDEYASTWIQTDEGDDIVMLLRRDARWKTLHCYVQSGERVGQGRRCGYYRFGSTVHLFLPPDARIACQVGDHVLCGVDIIATLSKRTRRAIESPALEQA